MDSSDVTDSITGIMGPLMVTGIAFAGINAFANMAENYSRPPKKSSKKKQKDWFDFDWDNSEYAWKY